MYIASLKIVYGIFLLNYYSSSSTNEDAAKQPRPRKHKTNQQCFSMCEPPDILRRHNGKMIKPTIVHNGIRPQSVFLYMYPEQPTFDVDEVGEPVFLTPYIKGGKLKEGREKARVILPKWPDIESYAGFLTVQENFNSNLYFWFFLSQSNPSEDPVALWLQVNVFLSNLILNDEVL